MSAMNKATGERCYTVGGMSRSKSVSTRSRMEFSIPHRCVKSAPWSIISIVSNNYVQMYLLSLKSFYRQLGRGNVIAIIDRDMTAASRALLEQHIPSIQFVSLEDIDTGICQRGGTWERLVYLLDRSEKEYVIQLDCDTLTFGHDVNEVVHCATSNIAFTLSNAGRPIEAMTAIVRNAELMDSNYVGIIAERFFNRYPREKTCAMYAPHRASQVSQKAASTGATSKNSIKTWRICSALDGRSGAPKSADLILRSPTRQTRWCFPILNTPTFGPILYVAIAVFYTLSDHIVI